ncbi:MAG: hypothetical protein IJJ42_09100 [Clostridia bacterium]|nr:hypothetical protein [Clostridia bacterium]
MKGLQKKGISIVTVCLGVYFMLMVFDSIPMFGIGSILRIMIILPVGAILLIKLRSDLEINVQILLILLYVFMLACSYLYSINRDETFKQFLRVLLNIAVVICAGGMYDYSPEEIDFLKKCLAAGGIITIVITLYLSDYSAAGRLTLSINGAVQDQNYLNGYVFFTYIYFLTLAIRKKNLLMILPSGAIILFSLMTGSRGALLALAGISVTIVFCGLMRGKRISFSMVVMIVSGVLFIVLLYKPVLSLLPEGVAERYTTEYIAENGSTGRSEIWGYLLERFANSSVFRVLFGYGFGTVAYLNEYNHLVAHNLWIEHLLAVGIIGEIVFVMMQAAYIRAAWKTNDIFVLSSYVGYLIMMISLSLLCYKPIWNCMMMILIVSRTYQTQKLENQEGVNYGFKAIG